LKVTIITATFNSASTIADTIQSVNNQSYKDIEHIIVDGASADNTLEIIKNIPNRVKTKLSEKDNGIYDAMNKGILMASGEVVGILNSDDYYSSNKVIPSIVEIFGKNKDVGVVWGNLNIVDKKDVTVVKRRYNANSITPDSFNFGVMPPHPTVFVRKEVYDTYGTFNLKYKIAADYELLFRILVINKVKYLKLTESLVTMRSGGISTRNIFSVLQLNKEVYDIHRTYGRPMNRFALFHKLFFRLREIY